METLATALEPFKRTAMLKADKIPPSNRYAQFLESQSRGSTTKPPEPVYRCQKCKDVGYYNVEKVRPGERWGKVESVRCWDCYDFLGRSRLTPAEQLHTIDCFLPRTEDKETLYIPAMKFLCREMLRDPFGFLSFQGSFGDGKSLALTALVAEFCRKKVQAQYWHIEDLLKLIMPYTTQLDGEEVTRHEIDNRYHMLHTIPVLAIDEPDKAVWSTSGKPARLAS